MPLPPAPGTPIPGVLMTAGDFIRQALRMINNIGATEVPSGADAADALISLNQMSDAWNADALAIPGTKIEDFPLTIGQQVYTLGSGGNFDTPRPAQLTNVSVILPTQVPYEVPLMSLTRDEWQAVLLKATPGSYPIALYDDGSFPFRNLSFWPIPQVPCGFRMYSWESNVIFPDLTTAFSFQPGYSEAIKYNLALRLSLEGFGQANANLLAAAQISMATIRAFNVEISKLECDEMFQGTSKESSTSQERSALFGIP